HQGLRERRLVAGGERGALPARAQEKQRRDCGHRKIDPPQGEVAKRLRQGAAAGRARQLQGRAAAGAEGQGARLRRRRQLLPQGRRRRRAQGVEVEELASPPIRSMSDWFARPVLHVADVAASVRFYVERLGFTKGWSYDEE